MNFYKNPQFLNKKELLEIAQIKPLFVFEILKNITLTEAQKAQLKEVYEMLANYNDFLDNLTQYHELFRDFKEHLNFKISASVKKVELDNLKELRAEAQKAKEINSRERNRAVRAYAVRAYRKGLLSA